MDPTQPRTRRLTEMKRLTIRRTRRILTMMTRLEKVKKRKMKAKKRLKPRKMANKILNKDSSELTFEAHVLSPKWAPQQKMKTSLLNVFSHEPSVCLSFLFPERRG